MILAILSNSCTPLCNYFDSKCKVTPLSTSNFNLQSVFTFNSTIYFQLAPKLKFKCTIPCLDKLPYVYNHHSDTDICTIFLTGEQHKLSCFSDEMCGMGLSRLLYKRSPSVAMYILWICIEYILYYLEVWSFRRKLQCLKARSHRPIARRIRQYLAACKQRVTLRNITASFLLLLLCSTAN